SHPLFRNPPTSQPCRDLLTSAAFRKCVVLSCCERAAGVGPRERPRAVVVGTDERHELGDEIGSRGEDPAADDLAAEDAEPDLDLIEPTRVCRSEVEVQALVTAGPRTGLFAAMRGAVVDDDVEVLAGMGGEQLAQESDERWAVVLANRLASHPPRVDFQRREQRRGAVALVLEAAPLDPMRL